MTKEENKNLENKIEKPSLYDFTRKSVVGAVYRVGASFTMDAIYLSLVAAGTYYAKENMESLESITTGFSDFVNSLDAGKLMRVAGFVVGINFLDYKFDITNKLNNLTKQTEKGLSKILGVEKRKGKKIYSELKADVGPNTMGCDKEVKTKEQFLEMCSQFLPAKLSYIKLHKKEKNSKSPFKYEEDIVDNFKEGFANNYRELTNFFNSVPNQYNFLDYFYETDSDKRDRIENKFSFNSYRRDDTKTWWMSQKDCRGDEEVYLIEKI